MKNEKGFSLLEVMVAIALIGIIAVAFLGGLSTASKAVFIADERATAESLARSQMEYVKEQDYGDAPWSYELPPNTPSNPPSWWATHAPTFPEGYDGYTVNVSATPLLDNKGVILKDIQKITITVYHNNKPIITSTSGNYTLEDYKVHR